MKINNKLLVAMLLLLLYPAVANYFRAEYWRRQYDLAKNPISAGSAETVDTCPRKMAEFVWNDWIDPKIGSVPLCRLSTIKNHQRTAAH